MRVRTVRRVATFLRLPWWISMPMMFFLIMVKVTATWLRSLTSLPRGPSTVTSLDLMEILTVGREECQRTCSPKRGSISSRFGFSSVVLSWACLGSGSGRVHRQYRCRRPSVGGGVSSSVARSAREMQMQQQLATYRSPGPRGSPHCGCNASSRRIMGEEGGGVSSSSRWTGRWCEP